MSGSRERILGAVRAGLGRGPLPSERARELDARLAEPRPNLTPARTEVSPAEQVELFVRFAEAVDTTTARVRGLGEVPTAVAAYLKDKGLPPRLKAAPHPDLHGLDWAAAGIEAESGRGEDPDAVGVAVAFAGIAESGTLFMTSGPDSPTTLNFLPDVHIVVVKTSDITGTYEDAFKRLRRHSGNQGIPRTVNWITGPSRTADIEQTLLLGVHGPRRLHVVLVDGDGA